MSSIISIILPLVAVAIAVILIISNSKKREFPLNKQIDKKEVLIEEDRMNNGIALGMCFGVAIGSAFANILGPEAISYGICFGLLAGVLIGMRIKKK